MSLIQLFLRYVAFMSPNIANVWIGCTMAYIHIPRALTMSEMVLIIT